MRNPWNKEDSKIKDGNFISNLPDDRYKSEQYWNSSAEEGGMRQGKK